MRVVNLGRNGIGIELKPAWRIRLLRCSARPAGAVWPLTVRVIIGVIVVVGGSISCSCSTRSGLVTLSRGAHSPVVVTRDRDRGL